MCSFLFGFIPAAVWCNDTLILYDSANNSGWIGYLNSVFLANLLGHFNVDYTILPIEDYKSMDSYKHVFYLGVLKNNQLPVKFTQDVLVSKIPVIWFGNNLQQLGTEGSVFAKKYGFYYHHFELSKYNKIMYKKVLLDKNKLDSSIGVIKISDNDKPQIIAKFINSKSDNESLPYIVKSENFWYVADIPFQYIDENNRYLAFADVLYDILDIKRLPTRRALLRLEDVNPLSDPADLKNIADYLYENNVPFAVALIPVYNDPNGVYNKGNPRVVKLTDKPDLISALQYMRDKGGTVILHGYTHQYGNSSNPYTATSGDDYEFLKIKLDVAKENVISSQPVPEDSLDWVQNKIYLAETELNTAGLATSLWETPHYAASMLDNQFFAGHFLATIGRIRYYDKYSEKYADQFFPYVIYKDVYGGKVLPENLGCIVIQSWFNFQTRTVDDILFSASKNLIVRDAWASFCYHPFLGLNELKKLVQGVQNLGYEFVSYDIQQL